MRLSVSYPLAPCRATANTAVVRDHFGVSPNPEPHVVAADFELPIDEIEAGVGEARPGRIVLFVGPSGSGKSSLLRAAAARLDRVLDIDSLDLGTRSLVDELPRRVDDGLRLLAMCGLGEARLLLRTPSELSEGQRYRFRLARGVAERPAWVLADEFTATLDRTLAKVVAFGARRLADREGVGFLLATTHEDVIADLAPDVLVRCEEGREPRVEFAGASRDASGCGEAGGRKKKRIVSFADEFTITTGTKRDWPYFAGWHYRGKDLGVTRFITLLWHGEQPAGICVFGGPAISLAARNRYFGLSGRWTRLGLQTLNRQLVTLSRVVLHPTYRGAGLGAEFVRRSCRACPFAWIETLAEMGHLNPVFERAGFERVGTSSPRRATREGHSALWGTKSADGKKRLLLPGSHQRSQWAEPVYYVFDNRKGGGRG